MDSPLVKNAADTEQVKEAKFLEKRRKEKVLSDVFKIMDTVEGRRYMCKLIEFCGVFKAYTGVDNRIYFYEGQRNVGLKLIADINESCPELYFKMISENKKEKK